MLDRNGNAVRDLTKNNFRIKVNKQPAVVLDAYYSLAPRRVVVLLDTSGSMAGEHGNKKWQIAREAVTDVSTIKPADTPLAFIAFSDQVNTTFGFGQGRPAIADWLKQAPSQREKVRGRTALFDAVVAGVKLLQPVQLGDAIYVITDGGDNRSHISASDTKKLLLLSGIRLFVFLFAEPMVMEEEREGVDTVMDIARDSGGFVFGASRHSLNLGSGFSSFDVMYDYNDRAREKMDLYAQEFSIQVNGFYSVQVTVPVQFGKGKVSLEIVDAAGTPRKDVGYAFQRVIIGQGK
ncbi:MAG: VWA domain-containing protein [Candidatus Koribacter versatilis]|nr:VWA domain-containing protein [Candidatus Koribacter versatilis]